MMSYLQDQLGLLPDCSCPSLRTCGPERTFLLCSVGQWTVMKEGATPGKGYTLPKEENGDYVIVTVDEVAYLVTEYYYQNDSKLAAGEESHQSLVQIYLSSKATNEDAALVTGEDGEYNILAVSQAVQTAGFDNAEEALNEAFGVVNAANAADWFANVQ